MRNNFDASVTWKDLEWVRWVWDGPLVIKGVLDPEDARRVVEAGADGLVVSNPGGHQLDGVAHVLDLIDAAMRVAMALTGVTRIDQISPARLAAR